jgi:hypothetical protein
MTRTKRKTKRYNTEPKFIRKIQHRNYRHSNRINIQKHRDVEKEPRTEGWIYW